MSDAIDTAMAEQRTEFAVNGLRRQPQWQAGTASLAGTRHQQAIQVNDPGGGPGR